MKKPDELIVEIDRSVFAKALVISLIAHVVLMGLTSIDLFMDWGRYGVHSPSYINAQKTRERKEAEETARKQAQIEKAQKEAAEAEAQKAAAATNKTAKAAAPAAKDAKDAAKPAGKQTIAAEEAGKKTPPEVQPLPPKKDFQYGDDLTLD